MSNFIPIFKELLNLELPSGDFVIFGSGPMYIKGIRDDVADIDIVARESAWTKALEYGNPLNSTYGGRVISLFGGDIEIFDRWAPGEWDTNDLIDNSIMHEGVRFVTLEKVIKYKKMMAREKDLIHLKMIDDYYSKSI